jgi:2,4-dienoyl-CoA reductase-like NADH-dependent reductase (Old Yellow Enzyme family)
MNNTPILFKELKVGELTIPNRIIMAALTRMRCDNSTKVPNDLMVTYYSQRASAGFILTEATLVSERSNAFPGCPGILNEA